MTTPHGSMTFTRFYDSVLSEIEYGKVDQGINLLAGLLDAVHLQGCSIANARDGLACHLLHRMLLEDPIYAQAAHMPGDYIGLVDALSIPSAEQHLSPTGRRLFEATANLPIIRALQQRHAKVHQMLERAWKDGQQICLVGKGANFGNAALPGRDLSNVTIIDIEAIDPPNLMDAAGMQFDLICLPNIADALDGDALFSLLAKLQHLVSPAGIMILSALRRDHLGSGWRQVCLNWMANTHDAQALQSAAFGACFSAQTYADQSDCIIWAELRPQDLPANGGNKSHAD